MLTGGTLGGLELRREADGSVSLAGVFPYGRPAILSDGGRAGGRPQKEIIARGAFDFAIKDPERDIHFLAGHSFDRVLASKKSGTLTFKETAAALLMTALIKPAILRASYAQDAVAQVEAGLATGLSPGFRIPPPSAVKPSDAETVEEEDPKLGRAIIRTVLQAILYEFSLVVRPAYPEATVEARNWTPRPDAPRILRWRA